MELQSTDRQLLAAWTGYFLTLAAGPGSQESASLPKAKSTEPASSSLLAVCF